MLPPLSDTLNLMHTAAPQGDPMSVVHDVIVAVWGDRVSLRVPALDKAGTIPRAALDAAN